ncbi:hypothetical protein [Streptomyces sp. NPDC007883]|uniref:hypothetical protein n=1 Tax=Streptomyces sp. NPDC007883 TaxID=3155116 RepID=UPI003409187D
MFAQIAIPGSDIAPGDILKRLPGVRVVSKADVNPRFPHSQTLTMADGSLYFIDPEQVYDVVRETPNAPARVLVVGNTTHPDGLASITALAHDVADRLQLPAVVAMGRDYDVRSFEAVVYDEASHLESVDSAVLWAEALEEDMCVMSSRELEAFDVAASCTWCGADDDDAEPILVAGTWLPADLCGPCAAESRRQGKARRLATI